MLTVPLKPFREAFSRAASVVPGKTTKPILTNIHCQVDHDGWLTLTGNTSETALSITMKLEKSTPCVFLLNATRGSQILRELTADELQIEIDGGTINLKCGSFKTRLQTEPADEFPLPPEAPKEGMTVNSVELSTALGLTMLACDTESTRYALGGVAFTKDARSLHLVATDTRRLSVSPVTIQAGAGKLPGPYQCPVVPLKAAVVVKNTVSMTDPQTTVFFSESAAWFESRDVVIWSRLVEGSFPRWADVTPKAHDFSFSISAAELAKAIRQVQVTTNAESCGADFAIEATELRISTQAADVG